jgi:hypothetical protein
MSTSYVIFIVRLHYLGTSSRTDWARHIPAPSVTFSTLPLDLLRVTFSRLMPSVPRLFSAPRDAKSLSAPPFPLPHAASTTKKCPPPPFPAWAELHGGPGGSWPTLIFGEKLSTPAHIHSIGPTVASTRELRAQVASGDIDSGPRHGTSAAPPARQCLCSRVTAANASAL